VNLIINKGDMGKNISDHYLGEKGQEYFTWQNQGELQRGRINARKFCHYIRPDDRLLDFGCGSGALLLNLSCKNKIGIEINPAARAEALKAGLEIYESLESITPKSIDIVISNHALEHVPYPLVILSGLFDCLISGGRLVLCLPFDDWRSQKTFVPVDINHHLYTWSPLNIGNLLLEAGYQVEKTWIYSHAWPPKKWQILDEKLPTWLFDKICHFTAWCYNHRQVMALARKP
jgi:SAM-dependent methyltransferase